MRAADAAIADAPDVEAVAHLALQVGRLLLLNGADAEHARIAFLRFAAAFGYEANLLVSYEGLFATLVAGEQFRTKVGHHLPGMNVGMEAMQAVSDIVQSAEGGGLTLSEACRKLDEIEHAPPVFPRWLVTLALALTAASLSRLFGGDWATFAIAGIAAAVGTTLRLELGARHVNPVLAGFAVSLLGGVVGGLGVLVAGTGSPALCLVAPAMTLVPGVPLINGVQDMIRNHVTLGMSRLGFAAMVVCAIAVGVFAATAITGVSIPLGGAPAVIGIPEDALFSALAAAGYAVLFGVPARMAVACMVCGVASHTLRLVLFTLGVDLIAGTLIGGLAAGSLSLDFARRFHAPAAAFAFPGVVALVPGSYAFRAFIGSVEIAHGGASPDLVAGTLSLVITYRASHDGRDRDRYRCAFPAV